MALHTAMARAVLCQYAGMYLRSVHAAPYRCLG